MLTGLLLVFWSTVAGAMTTYLSDERATIGARLAAGAAIGMAMLGFSGYAFSAAAGRMTSATLLGAIAATSLPLLLAGNRKVRARIRIDLTAAVPKRVPSWRRIALLAGWMLLTLMFYRLYQGTVYLQDGGIWTNNDNNLGDLPFHFSVIQGFLHGANFPPQDTEFAGARLTYPFLIDFVTAQYMDAGASATGAILLQNFVLAVSMLTLLYRTTVTMTRSAFAAIVAPLLFLFSGGLGFVHLFRDPHVGVPFLDQLRELPTEYTINADEGLRWGNAVTTLLTTQRGLLLAIPLALLVWTIWWHDREHRSDGKSVRRLATAGALTGLQPLIHGHTFLTLVLVGGIFAVADLLSARLRLAEMLRSRFIGWATFYGVAFALAVPQVMLLSQGSSVKKAGFFGYEPGWVAADSSGILGFWFQNLGLFLPLAIIAILARNRGKPLLGNRLVSFYLPFLVCFALPNIVRLAPWDMDNMKIFLYWHLASSILVASLLSRLWDRRHTAVKFVTVVLIVVLTLSGMLDVARVMEGVQRQEVFDPAGIAFAEAVQRATAPDSVILHYPMHNHPVLLAGRHLVMGYEGHLWSHGIDASERKRDVQAIYSGAPGAAALLSKYKIDYIVVGPPERSDPSNTNVRTKNELWSTYPVVAASGGYMLYDVRH